MKMNKRTIVLAVLVLLAGVTIYQANKADKPKVPYYPPVPGTAEVLPEPERADAVIEVTEIVITATPPKATKPVLHGTKLCRWYERAGVTAAHEAGDWLESTCHQNTCFLMVHETTVPSAYIMAGWLSEARSQGRDPRKDNIELSVFTFRGGEPYDHVIYYPALDEFREENF